VRATFKKTRLYLEEIKPKEDGKELDEFEMVRAGKVVEFEFSAQVSHFQGGKKCLFPPGPFKRFLSL